LFVSQNSDADVVQRAFEVGGKGYVLKSQAGSDLLPAVEAVLRGQRFVSGGLREHGFTDPDNQQTISAAKVDPSLLIKKREIFCH
jgi:DNA-binding NarL/FixJ family response regulator